MSERVDSYRPSYGRHVVAVPRRSVFCGTINKGKPFIADDEVQRRFWICEIDLIDVEALSHDRDQLLAEAKTLYEHNEPWWFDDANDRWFHDAMDDAQAPCRIDDPWDPLIVDYLNRTNTAATTATNILRGIDVPIAQINKGAEMRVAAALRKLGWAKSHRMIAGRKTRWWGRP